MAEKEALYYNNGSKYVQQTKDNTKFDQWYDRYTWQKKKGVVHDKKRN